MTTSTSQRWLQKASIFRKELTAFKQNGLSWQNVVHNDKRNVSYCLAVRLEYLNVCTGVGVGQQLYIGIILPSDLNP